MSGKFMLNGTEYLGGGSGGSGGNVDDVLVNGVSVVNEDKEAEIVSYKEVTQAEYNALPSSKFTDDIMYCIQDVGGADSYPPLIYSDEEREVGVWRDGKPLYQLSVCLSNQVTLTANAWNTIYDVSALNIDTLVHGIVNPTSLSFGAMSFKKDGNNLQVLFDQVWFVKTFTIQYTKTTDTAGSGIWTTQGTYTHHFSNNEQVVGTWIDGKPLYEKTISDTTTRSTGSNTISTGISNLETLIELKGTVSYGSNVTWLPIPLSDDPGSSMSNSQVKFSGLNKNNGNITFYIGTDFTGINVVNKVIVTLQYTKSSS